MASEYRVSAVVDPAGALAGRDAVKQALSDIGTQADATKGKIVAAFDQTAFDRSIGSLTSRIDNMDQSFGKLSGSIDSLAGSNKTLSDSWDKTATAAASAGTAQDKATESTVKSTQSRTAQEAAVQRVLQATDKEAAAIARVNALLTEATKLHADGAISAERLASVQKLATDVANGDTKATGLASNAKSELQHVVRATSDSFAAGLPIGMIFTEQMGRLSEVAENAGGAFGKFGAFMGGPYGIAVGLALTVGAHLVQNLIESGNAVGEELEKLKENAKQTEANTQAKSIFNRTTEGLIDDVRALTKALDEQTASLRSNAEQTNIKARSDLNALQRDRIKQADIVRKATEERDSLRETNIDNSHNAAGGANAAAEARLDAAQKVLKSIDDAITKAGRDVQESRVALAEEQAEANSTEVGRVTKLYDDQIAAVERLAHAHAKAGQTINKSLYDQIAALKEAKKNAIEAAQEEEKADKDGRYEDFSSPLHGSPRISTRFGQQESGRGENGTHTHQGVDYAVPVGTPIYAPQAGTVDVAGNRQGYGNAIYINFGAGTQGRFGHLSKFNVKPGDTVEAGELIGYTGGAAGAPGSGDSTGAHLHYEVRERGKAVDPTKGRFRADNDQANDDAQKRHDAEQKALAKKADEEDDFVRQIELTQGARGQTGGANQTQNAIDKAIAEFRKRFNVAASDGQQKRITQAITEGEARDTAKRFDTAYNEPLKRLQDIQDKTGIDREVLNAQLSESDRLGRKLTATEAAQIDASLRGQDALKREATILESIRQPQQAYADRIKDLNKLLKAGKIDQTNYNAEVAKLGAGARTLLKDIPGRQGGQSNKNRAAIAEENARDASQKKDLQDNRQELLKLGVDFDKLEEDQAKDHAQRLVDIRRAALEEDLENAQSISDSLLSIAQDSVGKQSAVYKGLFIISKGFAIADSVVHIQAALAKALDAPFPANLADYAIVAAQAASIVSNIAAVSANFNSGGYVDGPGTGTSDSIRANLSKGEYVVNAGATADHRDLLDAINSGTTSAMLRGASNDNRPGSLSTTSSGDTISISVGDVHVNGATSKGDGASIGRDVKSAIVGIVRDEIKSAKRPGGALTKTTPSAMTG